MRHPRTQLASSRASRRRITALGLFLIAVLAISACNGDTDDDAVGFQEVTRQAGESGDVVFVLISPGEHPQDTYEDLVRGLLAADQSLWGIEVFDNEEALEAALSPLLSADEAALLTEHHLVSVIGREVIRFAGPLSEWGEHPIGG